MIFIVVFWPMKRQPENLTVGAVAVANLFASVLIYVTAVDYVGPTTQRLILYIVIGSVGVALIIAVSIMFYSIIFVENEYAKGDALAKHTDMRMDLGTDLFGDEEAPAGLITSDWMDAIGTHSEFDEIMHSRSVLGRALSKKLDADLVKESASFSAMSFLTGFWGNGEDGSSSDLDSVDDLFDPVPPEPVSPVEPTGDDIPAKGKGKLIKGKGKLVKGKGKLVKGKGKLVQGKGKLKDQDTAAK